jgi:ATP-dependent HslUV protease ATP-binding subunit HslU
MDVCIDVCSAKAEQKRKLKVEIKAIVEEKILTALVGTMYDEDTRETFRKHLREGRVEDNKIEIEVMPKEPEMPEGKLGAGVMMFHIGGGRGRSPVKKILTVAEARPLLEEAELERLVSSDDVTKKAIKKVFFSCMCIVFIWFYEG